MAARRQHGSLEARLSLFLRRLRKAKPPQQGVDLGPSSAFDALLEQRMQQLERNFGELKGRVNGLIFVVLGAAVVQVLLRLLT